MISGIHLATALSVMLHMEQEGNGMDTTQDIVDELREQAERFSDPTDEMLRDAADRLSEQQQVIDELVKALEPFSAFADALNDDVPDDISLGIYAGGAMRFGPSGGANLASLRAARNALSHAKGHTKDAE